GAARRGPGGGGLRANLGGGLRPSRAPGVGAGDGAQGDQRVNLVARPVHPAALESRLHHQLVARQALGLAAAAALLRLAHARDELPHPLRQLLGSRVRRRQLRLVARQHSLLLRDRLALRQDDENQVLPAGVVQIHHDRSI
ncbi:MAG: hypothetical protein AVDCRST_MAG88-2844, partial [uncultured Thermomicrobiales bacterium]